MPAEQVIGALRVGRGRCDPPTEAARVEWCDGSAGEYERLCDLLVHNGTFTRLSDAKRPKSYWAHSDPADVARVESRTFICCENEAEDAGPTNTTGPPRPRMRSTLTALFAGSMRGRTMYVVPFSMGPVDSSFTKHAVQLTDSPYVVVSMRIMTRMGASVLDAMGDDGEYVQCLHSVGVPLAPGEADVPWPCDPEHLYISHFPESREIWSFGSGYGGNALLGKKCLALRIASVIARDEGWLAEHMLIVKLTSPDGQVRYLTGAFPSACGKTNLAMLVPTMPGWKVETVGDDICWLRIVTQTARLGRSIPKPASFRRGRPGDERETNPNAVLDARGEHDLHEHRPAPTTETSGGTGSTATMPSHDLTDWTGADWTPDVTDSHRRTRTPASRFPPPRTRRVASEWNTTRSACRSPRSLFGGPPVPRSCRSFTSPSDWRHGVVHGLDRWPRRRRPRPRARSEQAAS